MSKVKSKNALMLENRKLRKELEAARYHHNNLLHEKKQYTSLLVDIFNTANNLESHQQISRSWVVSKIFEVMRKH